MKKILFIATLWAIVFASCSKGTTEFRNAIEKGFNLASFTRINAGETFKINIQQGNNFSIKAKGRPEDLEDLVLSVELNSILKIKYSKFKNDRYRVEFTITMPRLALIVLDGAATATVNGFSDQDTKIRTSLLGTSKCTINGSAEEMQIDLNGSAELTLKGSTELVYGYIQGQSRVHAYDLNARIVEISTTGQTKTYVRPISKLLVDASEQSEVYYKGTPVTKEIDVSGQARVVQQ